MAKKYKYDYEAYKEKYMSGHRAYTFNLNVDKDKRLIEVLDRQENISSFIRDILRRAVVG